MKEIIIMLLPAIIQVESMNNPSAVGDGGNAIGILQIHKIVVDDVNRILGKKVYRYNDRWSTVKSKEMFEIYLEYYGEHYKDQWDEKDCAENLARIWNGGPHGWLKKSTDKYWWKVEAAMEKETVSKHAQQDGEWWTFSCHPEEEIQFENQPQYCPFCGQKL